MSSKQSIHALNDRLAKRMQGTSAASLRQSPTWLAVIASGRGFLFPLAHSGEIYPWVMPHKVPHTKDWFLGIANLRGSLCGVASLNSFFDLENMVDDQVHTAQALSGDLMDKRLIAFHPGFDMNTVLAVDQLAGLKNIDQLQPTKQNNYFFDDNQVVWRQVDLAELAQNPAFLNIQQ
jgi:twitching motility protein PilI